jgi:thioredoxin reductase
LYLDSATVSQKMEMMSCFLVTKTHALIATGVSARKIAFTRRRLLGYCAHVHGAKYKQEKEVMTFIAGKSISLLRWCRTGLRFVR